MPGERHCGAAEVVRFQASMAEFRREQRTPHCLENCDEVEFDVFGTVVNSAERRFLPQVKVWGKENILCQVNIIMC